MSDEDSPISKLMSGCGEIIEWRIKSWEQFNEGSPKSSSYGTSCQLRESSWRGGPVRTRVVVSLAKT